MQPNRIERPLVFIALVALGLLTIAVSTRFVGALGKHNENQPRIVIIDEVKPIPGYIKTGLDWLAAAQFNNGGWGSGQHSAQHIRDPRAVQIDAATTAFAAMALMRSGSTVHGGPYKTHIRKAVDYLLELVETSPENTSQISTVTGTQPQAKLGQNIDVSMVAQLLSRTLPTIANDRKLRVRVEAALDKCLRKLEGAQHADGSWNQAGWAPVLQSAVANSALEMAVAAGRKVDRETIEKSRDYQKKNVDAATGDVRTEAAAGIALYSIASNQRATAPEAREAIDRIEEAKRKGELEEDADVSLDNLVKAGYSRDRAARVFDSYRQNEATRQMLNDDRILSGFGNNGGEEFLSYMMTSESLVVAGGSEWDRWHTKMNQLFSRVQNADGSWSGHHCITSPVFCTAAVILTMTADRDSEILRNLAKG